MTRPAPPRERPWVWANCAISLDGRLAHAGGRRAYLSGPEDLARVQRIRRSVDGVLVGVGTVLADDPSLRVHEELLGGTRTSRARPRGDRPWRIVLDSRGRTPPRSKVLDGSRPTVLLVSRANRRNFPPHVRTAVVGERRVDLRRGLRWLRDEGVRRLMVEGGSEVLASFLRGGWVDRLTVYVAPVVIGGRSAPRMVGGPDRRSPFPAQVGLRLTRARRLGEGVLLTFEPPAAGRG